MKSAPNPSPNVEKLNDVIKYFDGNREKIKKFYTEELQKNPFLLIGKNNILSYIDNETRTEAAYKILESNKPEVWLRKCDKLAEIIPPHEIRKKILKIFSKSPKGLQNSIEQVEKLFNEENFNKFLQEGNFPEDTIVSLFLLFNSFKNIATFNDDIRRILESKAEDANTVHVSMTWEREPFGFACGGMEDNFYHAARLWKWICLINGCLFAKFYHHSWETIKVSYLPASTYKSHNGYIIWEDFFYSPSAGQEEIVKKAILEDQKQIFIPDLQIKAVRPAFGITSKKVRELTKELYDWFII